MGTRTRMRSSPRSRRGSGLGPTSDCEKNPRNRKRNSDKLPGCVGSAASRGGATTRSSVAGTSETQRRSPACSATTGSAITVHYCRGRSSRKQHARRILRRGGTTISPVNVDLITGIGARPKPIGDRSAAPSPKELLSRIGRQGEATPDNLPD